MLPGVTRGPGRGPPAPGPAPGRGPACGRGIGRSTGCCEENGLLPTRGGRGAAGLGPGRGPGVAPGDGALGAGAAGAGADAAGTSGAGGAAGWTAAGLGAPGLGPGAAGTGAAGAGAAALPLVTVATDWAAAGCGTLAGAFWEAVFEPPNDSRRRRATGASTVDDADFTNSPCSLSRARTSLLVTPSSLANSCTRALPATTSPV